LVLMRYLPLAQKIEQLVNWLNIKAYKEVGQISKLSHGALRDRLISKMRLWSEPLKLDTLG